LQVPALPDRLQAKQLSPQRLPQQTPSVQKPEAHSSSFAQAVAAVFLRAQRPAAQ
jgi:hypothetical protein